MEMSYPPHSYPNFNPHGPYPGMNPQGSQPPQQPSYPPQYPSQPPSYPPHYAPPQNPSPSYPPQYVPPQNSSQPPSNPPPYVPPQNPSQQPSYPPYYAPPQPGYAQPQYPPYQPSGFRNEIFELRNRYRMNIQDNQIDNSLEEAKNRKRMYAFPENELNYIRYDEKGKSYIASTHGFVFAHHDNRQYFDERNDPNSYDGTAKHLI